MKSLQHFLLLLLTALAMSLLTTFASTSTHNTEEPNKPLVQIFTGAYFTPMPQTLPYISSIPIIYKIPFKTQQNLPKNEPSLNFCPKNLNNSQTYCKIQNNLSTLETLIHQQMVAEHLPFIQRQQPDRNRRSLTFVGDFFEWCCDIATEHQIMTWQTTRKMSTQHSQHNNTTYSPSYLRIHLLRSQSTKTTPLPAKTRRQQHRTAMLICKIGTHLIMKERFGIGVVIGELAGATTSKTTTTRERRKSRTGI
ncbi:hypothetical protein J6590_052623 [Homalodisca vitripennis]|nr:hypothetical protein J6590_052623 [Homalodisca vitripennis]